MFVSLPLFLSKNLKNMYTKIFPFLADICSSQFDLDWTSHQKGVCAFLRCTSLTSVALSPSVTAIRRSVFYGCRSLQVVEIPASVTTIGNSAFQWCSSLTHLPLPSSVTAIGRNAFRDCSSMVSIEIPPSVTSIGGNAFRYCSSLKDVTIPSSVTSIEEGTFYGCHSLSSLEITTSLKAIDRCAFTRCGALAALMIKPVDDEDHAAVGTGAGTGGAANPGADADADANIDADEDAMAEAEAGVHLAALPWKELAGNVIADDDDVDYDDYEEDDASATTITRLWAPDSIIQQMEGPFAAYNSFAELPRAMRVAPKAKTWAAVQLWLWFAPPHGVGVVRRACYSRRLATFTVMLSAFRAAELSLLPRLPEELWLYSFEFLEHDEPPAYIA